MRDELLEYIVCPDDHSELELHVDEKNADEIENGHLTCTECSATYEIISGIPFLRVRQGHLTEDDRQNTEQWEASDLPGYDQMDIYQSISNKVRERQNAFIEMVRELSMTPGLTLDFCSGLGEGLYAMLEAGLINGPVIAVDAFPYPMIQQRESMRELGYQDRVHQVCADVRRLPFRDVSIDAAVSQGSFLPMGTSSEEMVEGAQDVYRVLKDGTSCITDTIEIKETLHPIAADNHAHEGILREAGFDVESAPYHTDDNKGRAKYFTRAVK